MNPTTPCLLPLASLVLAGSLTAQGDERAFLEQDVLGAMQWRSLGPVNFGGRVVDIEVDPRRSSTWYAATATGGLWKTENNGTTFRPVFDHEATVSIGDIALAPSDPDVVYVGTGEANNQRSSYWGDGVYRSADGGATWEHVGLEGSDHIGRIVVHPDDPDTVYVAAAGPLYTPGEVRGLFKTTDGGKSWTNTKYLGPDVGFIDVVLDPGDLDTLYAASYERRRRAWEFHEDGPGSAVWKTTDGGGEWQRLGNGLPRGKIGRIGLAVFPGDPRILYAGIENNNPRPLKPEAEGAAAEASVPRSPDEDGGAGRRPDDGETLYPFGKAEAGAPRDRPRRPTMGGEVYRSEDAGESWFKTHDDRSIGGRPGYYYGQIRVDPRDDQVVYVLSIPVYRSADGGRTWTPGRGRRGRRESFASRLHVDHHALWIDPEDSEHCLIGNDGGLARTWDGGATWDYLNELPIGQFYAVGVDLRDPYRIYGGLQDNGTWAIPSRSDHRGGVRKEDAVKIGGGDGFHVCVDPTDPDVVYYESQFGGLRRRNLATGERESIRPAKPEGSPPLRFNWMSPVLLSPHNPRVVYFGSQYLHRSPDRGDHWKVVSPDLTTADHDKIEGDVPHCTITTIAESPLHEGRIWVGTDDGRVWVTHDGGAHWQNLDDRFDGLPKPLWVSRVAASPHDAETAFVSFTGYREDIREPYLYLTTDGGRTFRSIANDLPRAPINVVRQHPRNAEVLLVGTEFGIHVSLDGGGRWSPLGSGLPTTPVHDLLVHPREPDVVLGTHGRGIWVLDATALEELDHRVLDRDFHVFAPRDGWKPRPAPNRGHTGARTWSGTNPPSAPLFRFYLREDSAAPVTVEVLDAAGAVLFETAVGEEDGVTAGLHTVPWSPEGRRRRRAGIPGGQFAVRIHWRDEEVVRAFRVR